ncbi:MAG: menaquinone biosynthetic enzyme MqnA/MqnD family protein [Frankia sp.]
MTMSIDGTPAKPRVGHIQFLNCLPLYWGLVHSGALLDVELTKATPDLLNEALVAGDLDIGPISVVEYLRHADELAVLPDLAVGADGPVLSVNMVSAVPLDQIRSVALGATSRTSVLLARMLLEDRDGLRPTYTTMPPDLPMMLREADAAVLIGDAALRATYEAEQAGPAHPLTVIDLSEQWRAWSGQPMVFAVWAARRDFAERNPGAVKEVHRAFRTSLDMALADVEAVAQRAARWEVFDPATLARYFRTLDFSLGERQIAGIEAFAALASERGEVPPFPGLTFAAV